MPRGSQHDSDEITWNTTGVRLGTTGLDLREPADPGALTELLNARFVDDRTIEQRDGHTGVLVQDSSDFAPLGETSTVTGEWVYGHGQRLASSNSAAWENAHHPIPGQARAGFSFDGNDVVWTGDRLLVVKGEGPALGGSTFWRRDSGTTELYRGIPAYLPLQSDSTPPASVGGDYVETCVTSKLRAFVHTEGTGIQAWIVDRATGTVIDHSEISGASNDPVEVKVINSAEIVVVVWRDKTTRVLYLRFWTGTVWSTLSSENTNIYSYDVAQVPGGFHMVARGGSPDPVSLVVTKYTGPNPVDAPYAARTTVNLTSVTLDGAVAIAISPAGDIALVVDGDTALKARVLTPAAALITGVGWTTVAAGTNWFAGVSVQSRGLKESTGRYKWIVHAARDSDTGVVIKELTVTPGSGIAVAGTTRFNSVLASKSFRIGDEVCCWLRSNNAGTHYLAAGFPVQVCGYADREEALTRAQHDGNYAIPHVGSDPLDEDGYSFTWIRPYNTGQSYSRSGNTRTGDLDFLPTLTPVRFGKSVYLSGSAVRNWDGVSLRDAGFHDYPVVKSVVDDPIGAPHYYYRIYAVKYNARGERFQSAAATFGPIKTSIGIGPGGFAFQPVLTIQTLPSVNDDDVVYEVYRTESDGTTFYLVGTVDNDLTSATVAFTDDMPDTTLITQLGDPHSAGVGALSELEEWGPLGCSMLAVSGDRLWAAGGQVPAGVVAFSKLSEPGEGAGFDNLAGFQTVDTEGRAITSVAPHNDGTIVFLRDRLNIIAGTGPDNYGRNSFSIPPIMLADGAVNHAGTVYTQLGTLYWAEHGPRLLTGALEVKNISAPIRPLTENMIPSGVKADLPRQEVVWYTEGGDAVLWNYLGDSSRWAQWNGLRVAGCTDDKLVMADGHLLTESPSGLGDDGQGFAFVWLSGNLRAEQIMQGATLLRALGITGKYKGPHRLRVRVFYNGSPMWTDQFVWEPETDTWLTLGEDFADLTPAEIDALKPKDKSGAYTTHKRSSRQECSYFKVEVSNIEAHGETYIPFELSLELGARGGLNRVPVNTFTTTIGR